MLAVVGMLHARSSGELRRKPHLEFIGKNAYSILRPDISGMVLDFRGSVEVGAAVA